MEKNVFFESIKCKDGKIHNIDYHNQRVNNTRKEIFGIDDEIDLSTYIKVPDNNFYKCRIEYGKTINSVEFIEYSILEKKRFKLVEINKDQDYSYKTTKRIFIDEALLKKGNCDDIIMLRGKYLTDSSVANIACYINGEWLTPDNPISKGTTRTRLLEDGKLVEGNIEVHDIPKIKKFALMNALFGFLEIEGFEIVR